MNFDAQKKDDDNLFKDSLDFNAVQSSVNFSSNYKSNNFQKIEIKKNSKFFLKIIKFFSNDAFNVRIIFIVGVLAIVLGAWHLLANIKNAFIFSPIVLEDKSEVVNNLNSLKDTDQDGISDYDEKYIYGTSPYLVDTDSDGLSDYEEITNGQEPLCAGTNCLDESNLESSKKVNILGLTSSFALGETMNLEQFKEVLIRAGYPAEEINKLSEEDLRTIYNEIQKQINANQELNINSKLSSSSEELQATNFSESDLEKMKKLSIAQIKDLLIQGGATIDQLNSISDSDLRNLYLKTLEEVRNSQESK